MRYVIASSRKWYEDMAIRLPISTGHEFILIKNKEDLTFERLAQIQPRYVFFPHWSYLVQASVFEAFECIIFHMTDLPFGRGGSPLQNLISRGIYETKVSALKCVAEVDAGPVYLKRPLSLHGTAEEIYMRAAKVVEDMVVEMVNNELSPKEQQGKIECFQRRKPEDSSISGLSELTEVFDYIRMLDADGYPKAFLETEHLRLEFQRPSLKYGKLLADVIITRKG
jgi:methionyl-tRNA formyltransferase